MTKLTKLDLPIKSRSVMDGWTRSSLQMIAEKLDRNAITFTEGKTAAERELGRKLSARTKAKLIKEMFHDCE